MSTSFAQMARLLATIADLEASYGHLAHDLREPLNRRAETVHETLRPRVLACLGVTRDLLDGHQALLAAWHETMRDVQP